MQGQRIRLGGGGLDKHSTGSAWQGVMMLGHCNANNKRIALLDSQPHLLPL